jgi:hypothetical protein
MEPWVMTALVGGIGAALAVHSSVSYTKGAFAMFKQVLVALALLTVCGAAAPTRGHPARAAARTTARGAEEQAKVELSFATEHVPAGLKAGAKVDLMMVNGRSVTPAGQVSYTTSTVAGSAEVASVTPVDKPATPEQAVKVELRVTKDQAARIERLKAQKVKTVETTAQGRVEKTVPVTFRLEPARAK